MTVTLKDIAAAAGVSIGTVERALKRKGRINPQVAERIRNLAEEMDYQPNKIASGLVNRNRKFKFAVVFHMEGNDFWNEVIKGIHKAEREIRDYGISVKLYFGKNFDAQIQLELIEQAITDGANAIVIIPINSPLIRKKLKELGQANFPIVFLTNYLNRVPCLTSIHCDYFRSGRIAAMLIRQLSCSKGEVLAFLPSPVLLGNNYRSNGIQTYFKENPPSLILREIVELSGNPESDQRLILDKMKEYPSVSYVIYNGDANIFLSALSCVQRTIIPVLFDLSADGKQALIDGRIMSVITQAPKEQGYQAINVLFQYFISNTEPKKEILMDSHILFKECID